MKDDYSFTLLVATVAELVDKVIEQKFIVSISIEDTELVIQYSDDTVNRFELPIVKGGIITKELDPVKLEKVISVLLKQEIERRLQSIIDSVVELVPKPKDGEDGQSVDEQKIIESLQTAITKKLEHEVEKIKQSIPEPINGVDGKDADEEKIVENITSVLIGKLESELLAIRQYIPEPIVPKDGRDADEEAIKVSLLEVINAELKSGLEKIVAEIPLAKDGVNGRDADEEAITNALETKLADKIANVKQELSSQITEIIRESIPDVKDGRDGKDADQEAILAALTELLNKRIKEQETSIKEALQDELDKIIASIPTPKDGLNGIDGQDGKNADEDKIISTLQDGLDCLVSSAIDKLQQDLRLFATETIDKIKSSFKPIKGDKGDTGEKGERGNGIKNAEIDRRDHLIITTDDQVIDAGQIKGKQIFYGGGTGSFKYTNTMPLPFDIGGCKQGTRFDEVEQRVLWTKLLYGWDLPSFSQFNIEDIPQNIEVGYQIVAGDYTANFIIDNPELLKEDSITIIGNDTEILSSLPNSSPIVLPLPEYKLDTLGVVNFQIYAYDTTGVSFLKNYVCNYKYKIYYGEYTEDIEDTGLPNPMSVLRAQELVIDIKGEYLFLDIGYKWFCYPESLGENYVFYEVTSDIAFVFDEVKKILITNEYGVALTYNCFRTLHEINQEFVMGIK